MNSTFASKLRKTVIGIVIILVIALIVIYFSLNSIISSGITTFGTKATGTKVAVQSLLISPFSGTLEINGLSIANPQGYQLTEAMRINKFYVNADISSLFSDRILINELIIDNIAIDYEPSLLNGSNIQQINENISSYINRDKPGTPSSSTKFTNKKKTTEVVIKHVVIKNGSVSLSSSVLKSSVRVIIPKLDLYDIGENGNESAAAVFQTIFESIMDAISTAGANISGIDLSQLSQSTGSIGKEVGNAVNSITKSLGL